MSALKPAAVTSEAKLAKLQHRPPLLKRRIGDAVSGPDQPAGDHPLLNRFSSLHLTSLKFPCQNLK